MYRSSSSLLAVRTSTPLEAATPRRHSIVPIAKKRVSRMEQPSIQEVLGALNWRMQANASAPIPTPSTDLSNPSIAKLGNRTYAKAVTQALVDCNGHQPSIDAVVKAVLRFSDRTTPSYSQIMQTADKLYEGPVTNNELLIKHAILGTKLMLDEMIGDRTFRDYIESGELINLPETITHNAISCPILSPFLIQLAIQRHPNLRVSHSAQTFTSLFQEDSNDLGARHLLWENCIRSVAEGEKMSLNSLYKLGPTFFEDLAGKPFTIYPKSSGNVLEFFKNGAKVRTPTNQKYALTAGNAKTQFLKVDPNFSHVMEGMWCEEIMTTTRTIKSRDAAKTAESRDIITTAGSRGGRTRPLPLMIGFQSKFLNTENSIIEAHERFVQAMSSETLLRFPIRHMVFLALTPVAFPPTVTANLWRRRNLLTITPIEMERIYSPTLSNHMMHRAGINLNELREFNKSSIYDHEYQSMQEMQRRTDRKRYPGNYTNRKVEFPVLGHTEFSSNSADFQTLIMNLQQQASDASPTKLMPGPASSATPALAAASASMRKNLGTSGQNEI